MAGRLCAPRATEYAAVVVFNSHHNKENSFKIFPLQMSWPSSKALKGSSILKAILAVNTALTLSVSIISVCRGDNRNGEMAPEMFELYFLHPYGPVLHCHCSSLLSSSATSTLPDHPLNLIIRSHFRLAWMHSWTWPNTSRKIELALRNLDVMRCVTFI